VALRNEKNAPSIVILFVNKERKAYRTASDTWWMGVRRLAVANGPNIFQMLLVLHVHTLLSCNCVPTV